MGVGMVGGVRGKTGPLEVVVGQATVEGGSWGEGPGIALSPRQCLLFFCCRPDPSCLLLISQHYPF